MSLPIASRQSARAFAALVGVTACGIVLQGLWAGLFMSHLEIDPRNQPWLEVHSWCGKAAILFAVLATAWAFLRLKEQHALRAGAVLLTFLLVLESFVGGRMVDEDQTVMAAVHIPLALALTGVAVWLPLKALALVRSARR